jgi:hypothetical protein
VRIGLAPKPTRCSGSCFFGIKLGIGWRGDIAHDAQQGAEGVEGVEAAVEAERELIEVRLQMLRADAVMDAAQPGFEIGEREVHDGQKGFGDLHIATFRDSGVQIVALGKASVAAPVVGDNGGAWRHGAFDEAAQRLGASVRHQGEPDTTGVPPTLPLVEAAGMLALTDFDGTCHNDHIVDAAPLAARTTAHVGFIGLDDFFGFTTDPILIRSHHADAQLVKNLKGSFVARQSELPLELNSRYAGCLTGDQVRSPEPNRERRVRAHHDGASGEARIAVAMATPENAGAIGKAVRLTRRVAVVTDESTTPSGALKVGRARRFVREQSLEFWKRARKRQVVSLKHVDNHGCHTLELMPNILLVVVLGDNPISTE